MTNISGIVTGPVGLKVSALNEDDQNSEKLILDYLNRDCSNQNSRYSHRPYNQRNLIKISLPGKLLFSSHGS